MFNKVKTEVFLNDITIREKFNQFGIQVGCNFWLTLPSTSVDFHIYRGKLLIVNNLASFTNLHVYRFSFKGIFTNEVKFFGNIEELVPKIFEATLDFEWWEEDQFYWVTLLN